MQTAALNKLCVMSLALARTLTVALALFVVIGAASVNPPWMRVCVAHGSSLSELGCETASAYAEGGGCFRARCAHAPATRGEIYRANADAFEPWLPRLDAWRVPPGDGPFLVLWLNGTRSHHDATALARHVHSSDIVHVARVPRVRPLNRYAVPLVFAGAPATDVASFSPPPPPPPLHETEPSSVMRPTGANETVAVSDTGLDLGHCLFYDASGAPPGPRHRKVEAMFSYRANHGADLANGHGTHVSGSLAGSVRGSGFAADDPVAQYQGAAPDARLVFFDLGSDTTGNLDVPADLQSGLLDVLRGAGARISSQSWGADPSDYSLYTWDVDSAGVRPDAMLVVIAAGNDGATAGASSVGAPADAKNALTVGASLNAPDAFAFLAAREFVSVSDGAGLRVHARLAAFGAPLRDPHVVQNRRDFWLPSHAADGASRADADANARGDAALSDTAIARDSHDGLANSKARGGPHPPSHARSDKESAPELGTHLGAQLGALADPAGAPVAVPRETKGERGQPETSDSVGSSARAHQTVRPRAAETGTPLTLRAITPADGCSGVVVPDDGNAACSTGGWIALVQRGTCSFFEKARAVRAAGASAMLVVDTTVPSASDIGLTRMGLLETDSASAVADLTCAMVSSHAGALLRDALARSAACGVRLSLSPLTEALDLGSAYSTANVADFSSRGPTRDLRIKPEVLAPGKPVVSAAASGSPTAPHCGLDSLRAEEGTSMSTPLVAGAAAALREFLRVTRALPSPSAALLRALLVHSARVQRPSFVDMTGVTTDLQSIPHSWIFHGFGHVQLANVLRPSTQLVLVDVPTPVDKPAASEPLAPTEALATGQSWNRCYAITVASGAAANVTLRATLTWADPPSGLGFGWLVSDLDLTVRATRGAGVGEPWMLRGNHAFGFGQDGDKLNNVEQVISAQQSVSTGSLALVTVSARTAPLGLQGFALAVSTDDTAQRSTIVEIPPSACDTAGLSSMCNGCSARGQCVAGTCVCAPGVFGSECGLAPEPLLVGEARAIAVEPFRWSAWAVNTSATLATPPRTLGLVIQATRTSALGDVRLFAARGGPGDAQHFSATSAERRTSGAQAIWLKPDLVRRLTNSTLYISGVGHCCETGTYTLQAEWFERVPPLDEGRYVRVISRTRPSVWLATLRRWQMWAGVFFGLGVGLACVGLTVGVTKRACRRATVALFGGAVTRPAGANNHTIGAAESSLVAL